MTDEQIVRVADAIRDAMVKTMIRLWDGGYEYDCKAMALAALAAAHPVDTDAQVEAVAEIIRQRGRYDNAEDCARAALAAAHPVGTDEQVKAAAREFLSQLAGHIVLTVGERELNAMRAALAAAQAGAPKSNASSIDAQRRAEIADLCKANALLHAFMKDWDAEIARLRAENERLQGIIEAIGDEEREK